MRWAVPPQSMQVDGLRWVGHRAGSRLAPKRIAAPIRPATVDPTNTPILAMSTKAGLVEGEAGDEQGDGEPDSADRSEPDEMSPGDTDREGYRCRDGCAATGEEGDADRLAHHQTQDHSEPNRRGHSVDDRILPRRSTPALASANRGTTTNELHPTNRVSSRVSGETDSLAISLSSMASWSACSIDSRSSSSGQLVDYGSPCSPVQLSRRYMGRAGVSRPRATPAKGGMDAGLEHQVPGDQSRGDVEGQRA